jgi:16S rRNA A1518/A1519 N6-dimethyltransferase RsmA/KsgA/DIM1 with predicted DNA glycosylase/AP lyase activity
MRVLDNSTAIQDTEHFDAGRLTIGRSTNREQKSALGQFLTPYSTAQFMASLFTKKAFESCRLVDPGAGLGALTGAFIERWKARQIVSNTLHVTAFEIDDRLRNRLSATSRGRCRSFSG